MPDSFLYLLVVGVGLALACYLVNAPWMGMYWVDPEAISWWHLAAIFSIGYPVCFTLGFLVGGELERVGWGEKILVSLLGAIILIILLALGRSWAVSTYADFPCGRLPASDQPETVFHLQSGHSPDPWPANSGGAGCSGFMGS